MLFRKVLLVPVEGKNGQKIEHSCSELHLALGDQPKAEMTVRLTHHNPPQVQFRDLLSPPSKMKALTAFH
jgi:hypothetical protein